MTSVDLGSAIAAIHRGEVIIYPTETVYGLGANALDSVAVEQVFDLKRRDRSEPISVSVGSIDAVESVANPTPQTMEFIRSFLPGPVTVVCERTDRLPDILTAGQERVGIRIPDHEIALALLDQTPPLTATSANRSGEPSAREVDDIAESLRTEVGAILDSGRTAGHPSTVVDVDLGLIHRRGANVTAVESWLVEHTDYED